MKKLTKSFGLSLLLVLGLGEVCSADTPANLPKSNKVEKVAQETKEDLKENNASLDELPMKLEMNQSAPKNPALKKGKGCADVKGLKEVHGKILIAAPDYPEAETLPCDEVDCKDLPQAQLGAYKVHSLPTAETEVACEE